VSRRSLRPPRDVARKRGKARVQQPWRDVVTEWRDVITENLPAVLILLAFVGFGTLSYYMMLNQPDPCAPLRVADSESHVCRSHLSPPRSSGYPDTVPFLRKF